MLPIYFEVHQEFCRIFEAVSSAPFRKLVDLGQFWDLGLLVGLNLEVHQRLSLKEEGFCVRSSGATAPNIDASRISRISINYQYPWVLVRR